MKTLYFLIISLLAFSCVGSEIRNIRNKFRKRMIHSDTITNYVNGYFASAAPTTFFLNGSPLDHIHYQVHYSYLPTNYQVMVKNIAYHYPVSSWPLVVRKLILPNVYGYYTTDKLEIYLGTLHTHLTNSYPIILQDSFNHVAVVSNDETQMNDVIKDLCELEEKKKTLDEELVILGEILEIANKKTN